MPRSRQALGFGRVNLLKKIKLGGKWTFCPAVVEHEVKVDHFPVEKLLAGKFASVSLELSDHRYPQNPGRC
ncbi:MAG TPA: hypothetical protein VGL74_04990 [Terriglobales bacterium]|jgi:hypothetical protein